ncbi:RAM signaling SOG2 [Cordyceps militaris]|uniref:RAM signaling SOG2 n=1 Tax=Cordyceps militaris TaxID=73501 RepID=A0A2H4S7R4_CORMI|nr:RAM signaling SOG2 [Cordyceps militaris]
MERPDRADRAPLPVTATTTAPTATATTSTSSGVRGLPENPAQGRRPVPNSAATSNGATPLPPPPIPTGINAAPNGNLAVSRALTPAQVISLARDAMRMALESEGQTVEASSAGTGLKSGVTVDLSRKSIQKLPEEVVDIVKDELERLALSHNQLSALPVRFSECTSLRYLNIRGNLIKEFPMTLCDLTSLEILDLGRNQLRSLPNEIGKLVSLKVLSVPKNHIRELPLCLADMGSLQVLKFEGNPISFPPKDALRLQAASPSNEARETEVTEVAVTAHIKKFMRQFAINGKMEAEGTGDESSENAETPRYPLKRAASGRFPIRVNGSDPPDIRSPNLGARAPPIPSRSHNRGLSQQNTAIRRPSVMPLTIGNVNERLRSNSESLLRPDRPDGRNRRMGIVSKKTSELDTLEEAEPNNRFSHYRGLSHGSAMQETPAATKSPATPTDGGLLQRPIYVRRLSVLPERRRESKVYDPIIESAKGILYSVFQIHPMIQMLMTLTNDGSAKRSSLEIVFYNTNSHVEELEQEIQRYESAILEEGEYNTKDNQNVHRACQTLVSAYGHVCTLLADNIDTFVNNGDARYIRSLLMLLYNSIMELRVTLCSVSSHSGRAIPPMQYESNNDTIKPYTQNGQVQSTALDRNGQQRSRQGTIRHSPANSRSSQDHQGPYMSGPRRPNAYIPNDQMGPQFPAYNTAEDDMQFERILVSLQKSADIVLQVLPNFSMQLAGRLRNATQQRAPEGALRDLKGLINICNDTVQQSDVLKNQLGAWKRRDPSLRVQPGFGVLCRNFFSCWASTAGMVKELTKRLPLPPDTRVRLRPIQQMIKDTSNLIVQSPWQHLIRAPGAPGMYPSGIISPSNVPITPQSAALGPAMQATVPVTPQSASFARAFHGNVFDRADALIANPGISMSRSGPMSRGHSNLSSLSSISSISSDGAPTPPSHY